jgi:hypothetical protein
MLTRVETYGDRHYINAKATLAHPLADEVSIALGDGAYARFPHTVELAFFKDGEWVTSILDEFAAYADGPSGDTLVYTFVPLIDFAMFMENFGTGGE